MCDAHVVIVFRSWLLKELEILGRADLPQEQSIGCSHANSQDL